MFTLIDSLLSVEICLHHQVLPLFLEGSRLHLGMVFPDDRLAQDYTRQIASYLNYSLVSEPIPGTALQASLSAYLKHSRGPTAAKRPQPRPNLSKPSPSLPLPSKAGDLASGEPAKNRPKSSGPERRNPAPDGPTDKSAPDKSAANNSKPSRPASQDPVPEVRTYILDVPTHLDNFPQANRQPPALPSAEATQPTLRIKDRPQPPSPQSASKPIPASKSVSPAAPALALDTRYPDLPFEQLRNLLPRDLLPELIARALNNDISRLYFEAQDQQGRILLSDNGVVRSAIDALSREQLCGVVQELKQFVQLPAVSTRSSQRTDLEYTYGGSSVLLRVKIASNHRGESATLQVLQGAALKVYRRQKLMRSGREAIDAAKQVQLRVSEFSDRLSATTRCPQSAANLLQDLGQILQGLNNQVEVLQQSCAIEPPETSPKGSSE